MAKKELTNPVDMGSMNTLGPSSIRVKFKFNPATGEFEVGSVLVDIVEGEVQGDEFRRYGGGTISRKGVALPQAIINRFEALAEAALDLYASEKEYS